VLVFNGLQRSFQLTTPLSLELHESLALLRRHGVDTVAMEVSSHALMQQRVAHCFFNSAVITNITRDHLDYHHTMERYLAAKSRLFALLKESSTAGVILNADDQYFTWMEQCVPGKQRLLYGIDSPLATVQAVNLSAGSGGNYRFELTGWESSLQISLNLPGLFNVYNALAAAAAALKDGLAGEAVERGLNKLNAVPGRLEEIPAESGFTVIVDYAHTPDGLEQVLKLLRQRAPRRVITVFGCPGERDRGKRPLMGRIAERYSDLVVVTADNPAGEEASIIIQEIKRGMQSEPALIEDRRSAVLFALKQAGPGDFVLLAGKGAEEYQLIGDEALPYNERNVVEEFLGKSSHS
jgi:UDP-N-acetylmuramoyl-L-alanyl-D-glutamate--2,6-diaminopimelate ligase